MRYMLDDFDLKEFQEIDLLVRSVYVTNNNALPEAKLRTIHYVGNAPNTEAETYISRAASKGNEVHALCTAVSYDSFDICINEGVYAMDPAKEFYRYILLHELCHGYLGPVEGHGPAWLNFYSKVLAQYHLHIKEIPNLQWLISKTFNTYTRRNYFAIEGQIAIIVDQSLQKSGRVKETMNDLKGS